jgi:hypothetical protein
MVSQFHTILSYVHNFFFRFSIFELNVDYEDDVEEFDALVQIYKKFLIGSKVCNKVEVNDYDQLQTLAHVALTHPMSLQQLREVRNGAHIASSLLYADQEEPDIDDIFNMCFKVEKSAPITKHYLLISCDFHFSVLL